MSRMRGEFLSFLKLASMRVMLYIQGPLRAAPLAGPAAGGAQCSRNRDGAAENDVRGPYFGSVFMTTYQKKNQIWSEMDEPLGLWVQKLGSSQYKLLVAIS